MTSTNQQIVKRIKEARTALKMTQQDVANRLNKTAAAVSDLERGKVQISAGDLSELADLFNKPIEYFYGEDFYGDDVQNLITIIRKMTPEARKEQLPVIQIMLQMQEIGKALELTENQSEQLKLAETFYTLLVPFSVTMNKINDQVKEIKGFLEELLTSKKQ
jgi:transcriptional regulator with XRE-family HTH domain